MNQASSSCILYLIVWAISFAAVCLGSAGTVRAAEQSNKVALVVDYGDGVQKHFPQMQWRESMTVLDLMEAAKKHPRGIDFQYRGRGPTAFLFQIDDLKNEGRGRNWVYRINGQLADRSFAVHAVQREDRVVWEFGEYREN